MVLAAAVVLVARPRAAGGNTGFGFNASGISGPPAPPFSPAAAPTTWDWLRQVRGRLPVHQRHPPGPAGRVLWLTRASGDTAELLARTTFWHRAAAEPLKTAVTDRDKVVLLADSTALVTATMSLHQQMIVPPMTSHPMSPGSRTSIQGVGCAPAIANPP
jgi:hypothetical protein